ncbi:hypothetical protein [Rhizobium sp. HT1-10]|uniref:hypothetical protein n=1 Tax=Rhizobium sp. HT1-10 TaxID=3111638 RepID=UPI003C2A0CC4
MNAKPHGAGLFSFSAIQIRRITMMRPILRQQPTFRPLLDRTVLKWGFAAFGMALCGILFFYTFPGLNRCSERSLVFLMWPQNYYLSRQLFAENINLFDVCMFLNVNAISSFIFFVFFTIRIFFRKKFNKQRLSVKLTIYCLICIFVALAASMSSFTRDFSPFQPSLAVPMAVNVVRSIAEIFIAYLCLGEIASAAIRKYYHD